MDRKLASIEEFVQSRAGEFREHLDEALPLAVHEFVRRLQRKTQVYLFSGIIRDFFLNRQDEMRDVDFIIEDEVDIRRLFPTLPIIRNSFDGYKTRIDSLSVDLWGLDKTWALNQGQLKFRFRRLEHLPATTFFNCSSILFSFDERKFIIGKPFLRFLRDRVLDIVHEENPLPALCIINSFYYSEKYKLKISEKLHRYILDNYTDQQDCFHDVQIRHFNKILFSPADLNRRFENLC